MRTIFELLTSHTEAVVVIDELKRNHDVWIVGGAARALVYNLPFPSDIDILINNEMPPGTLRAMPDGKTTGSGEQGQKQKVGEVHLDIFENGIVKWLAGVPCLGDCLAVRVSDNFVLSSANYESGFWHAVNPRYNAEIRPEYLAKHQASLQRDQNAANL